jgi:hypothetical protein
MAGNLFDYIATYTVSWVPPGSGGAREWWANRTFEFRARSDSSARVVARDEARRYDEYGKGTLACLKNRLVRLDKKRRIKL